MRTGVDLAKFIHRDQGVHLRGRHRGVPEKLLHHPDVRAPVQEVGGERMPQGVRRHLGESRPSGPRPAARPTHPAWSAARRARSGTRRGWRSLGVPPRRAPAAPGPGTAPAPAGHSCPPGRSAASALSGQAEQAGSASEWPLRQTPPPTPPRRRPVGSPRSRSSMSSAVASEIRAPVAVEQLQEGAVPQRAWGRLRRSRPPAAAPRRRRPWPGAAAVVAPAAGPAGPGPTGRAPRPGRTRAGRERRPRPARPSSPPAADGPRPPRAARARNPATSWVVTSPSPRVPAAARRRVAPQVPAVGLECVGGQAALDRQVVEVAR